MSVCVFCTPTWRLPRSRFGEGTRAGAGATGALPRVALAIPEVQLAVEGLATARAIPGKVWAGGKAGWRWARTTDLGGVPPGWITASGAGGGNAGRIDKRIEPIAQKYAAARGAGQRPLYRDVFPPSHGRKTKAEQRAAERELRDYVRIHQARLGVQVPHSGGTRGGNAATIVTLDSIDEFFANRGIATQREYLIEHKPGRRSIVSERWADRVVFDGADVYVIQSVEPYASRTIALRERWAGGDIIASKTVADFRAQRYTVLIQFIRRGDPYLAGKIVTEAEMMKYLQPKRLYPIGKSVGHLRRW